MAFTLVTNFSYTVFLTTLSTTLLSLNKSKETVFNLSISTSDFKLAKSDFAAKLDLSTPVPFF